MTLFEQVSKDIVAAMKAKDKVRLEALRNIKKVFLEAKTAPGANDTLEDADAMKILQKLAKQGHDSAELYAGTWPTPSWRRWPSSRATCRSLSRPKR